MNKIQTFLKERPAINLAALGVQAGFEDRSYFRKMVLEQNGKSLNEFQLMKVAHVLCSYGLEIDGWKFYREKDIEYQIFAYKFVTGENEEVIDKGDHFEYTVKVYRQHWDQNDFYEFIHRK